MRKIILVFVIMVFVIGEAYSQHDFRKGFVIKNNNDTIHGFIDYKGDKANTKSCLFGREKGSEKIKFTPDEIKAYRFIDSKYYVSRLLSTGEMEQLIFLEYLIDGIVDIYYYRDDSGEHYMVDKGDGILLPLKNQEKLVVVDMSRYLKESKEYIGVLKYAFNESPQICKRVEKISLGHKSLIDIADSYHQEVCKDGKCIRYEKKITKYKTSFGFLVGSGFLSLSTKDVLVKSIYYLKNADFDAAICPSIGFFYKFNIPSLNERLNVLYEGTYSKWRIKGESFYVEPIYNLTYINNMTLSQNAFNNSVFFRYEFPKGKLRPAFQAGCFVNYYFESDFIRNHEARWPDNKIFNAEVITENPFSKSDYGLSLGLGLIREFNDKQEVYLDIKYKQGFGLNQIVNSNTLEVTLGIQVWK